MRRSSSLPLVLAVLGPTCFLSACSSPAGRAGKGSGLDIVPATSAEVVEMVRSDASPVTIVNVWATWCVPCQEEMPDLIRLYHAYRSRGLDLILVSANASDQLPAAREFLRRQGVDFTTYIRVEGDTQFVQVLSPRWTGAIPASFVYGKDGALRYFWEGKATYAQFEEKVLEVLGGEPQRP